MNNYNDVLIKEIHSPIKLKDTITKNENFSRKKKLWENGWTSEKQNIARKWINKLQYEGHVSYFFVYNLKWYEGLWSWIIIVISTLTSALSLVQLDETRYTYVNSGIKVALSIAAIITTLLAAWIKKENYAGRIQETDRYLQKIQKLTTECDHILTQDIEYRISYNDYVEEYQQSVINLLAATVPMSPEEYKKAVYNITKYYPESVQNLWPWYEIKHLSGKIYYHEMTDFGNDVLKSYTQIKYKSFLYKILCCYYCQSKCCEQKTVSVFTDPINYNKYEIDKQIKLINYKDRIEKKLSHILDVKKSKKDVLESLTNKQKSLDKIFQKKRNKNIHRNRSKSTLENLRPYYHENN